MTIWVPDLTNRTGPLFRQLSDAIAEGIKAGQLPVGSRLPPQRKLAEILGLSLNTVSHAYADATERGFLRGEVGRGTYVRATGPLAMDSHAGGLIRQATGPIDFSLNLPVPSQASTVLKETLLDLSRTNDLLNLTDYQTSGSLNKHAIAAKQWLKQVGLDASPERIILSIGAQHGILATLLATMRPGDVLLTEELTYSPISAIAQHLDLKIVPIAGNNASLCVNRLDAVCHATAAKVLYCMPTLHTPTTATMDSDQRSAIAQVARKHDLMIIEDDVFGFLPEHRPPPLAKFAPERTVYITSVSKSLAPGLRVGYVHAPEKLAQKINTTVQLSCWMPPPLTAEIASRWITDGTAARLNDFQRRQAMERQLMAKQIIPGQLIQAHPNGFHLWLSLPPDLQPDRFRIEAEKQGVKLVPGSAFAVDSRRSIHAVRLCLSHEGEISRVREGLKILAAILESRNSAGQLFL